MNGVGPTDGGQVPERHHTAPALIRVGTFLAVALACVVALAYLAALARLMAGPLEMNDFGKFYHAARLFLAGGDMYGETPATYSTVAPGVQHAFWNLNPPHFHLLLLPLVGLGPAWALLLWAFASLATLVASVAATLAAVNVRPSARLGFWILAGVICFAGTGATVVTGQVGLLLLLPVTMAWLASRQGHAARSGVWLGLAMSVKPFLLILLPYYLFLRQRRAVTAAILTASAMFGIGLLVFGMDTHRAWIDSLSATDWTWAAMNASILGVVSRTFGESPYYAPLAVQPGLIRPIWITLAGVVSAAAAWRVTRGRTTADIDRSWALLLLTALLVSPLGWVYYLWLPLPPLFVLLGARIRPHVGPRRAVADADDGRPRVLIALALPGLVCPLHAVTLAQPSAFATLTLGSAYFWATAALWGAVLVSEERAPGAGGAGSEAPGSSGRQ